MGSGRRSLPLSPRCTWQYLVERLPVGGYEGAVNRAGEGPGNAQARVPVPTSWLSGRPSANQASREQRPDPLGLSRGAGSGVAGARRPGKSRLKPNLRRDPIGCGRRMPLVGTDRGDAPQPHRPADRLAERQAEVPRSAAPTQSGPLRRSDCAVGACCPPPPGVAGGW